MIKTKKYRLHFTVQLFAVFLLAVGGFVFFHPASAQATSAIRLTEIMYDPSGDGSKEFIEIHNGSDTIQNIGGSSMVGVDFVFPAGTSLASKEYAVIVRNFTVFRASHPSARIIGQQYGGKLKGSGELVQMIGSNGQVLSQVSYTFGGVWPVSPRDGGESLSLIRTNANETLAACWAASASVGGTPSYANSISGGGGGGCSNVAYPVTAPPASTQQPGSANTNSSTSSSTPAQAKAKAQEAEKKKIAAKKEAAAKREQIAKAKAQEAEVVRQAQEVQAAQVKDSKTKIVWATILGSLVAIGGTSILVYEKLHHKKKFRKLIKKSAQLV